MNTIENQEYSSLHQLPTGYRDGPPSPTLLTDSGPVNLKYFPSSLYVGALEFDQSTGWSVWIQGDFLTQPSGFREMEGRIETTNLPQWLTDSLETWSMEHMGFEWKLALTRSKLFQKAPIEAPVVEVLKMGPHFHPPHLPTFARIKEIGFRNPGHRYMGNFSVNLIPAKIVSVQTPQVVIESPTDWGSNYQTVVGGKTLQLVMPETITSPKMYAMKQQSVHVVQNEGYRSAPRWHYSGFISRNYLGNIDWSTAEDIEHPEYPLLR